MKFSVSRREIGHGNLAQRALKLMISEENLYTIRVVSEILESTCLFQWLLFVLEH